RAWYRSCDPQHLVGPGKVGGRRRAVLRPHLGEQGGQVVLPYLTGQGGGHVGRHRGGSSLLHRSPRGGDQLVPQAGGDLGGHTKIILLAGRVGEPVVGGLSNDVSRFHGPDANR